MTGGTHLNQLQDGLTSFQKLTDSQLKKLEMEMMALKRKLDSIMQHLAYLTLELQKSNKSTSHGESSLDIHVHWNENL